MNIKKLNSNAVIPTYGSKFSAGADLYACTDGDVIIMPGETKMIGTGIAMEIPIGYAGFLYARSGLASKEGLAPANKVGVIDSDFRGEIKVAMHNHSKLSKTITNGQRIAQIVIAPVLQVEFNDVGENDLNETDRGAGGFGSTGRD